MNREISFVLNGEQRRVDVSPGETLLEMLRRKLGVKSPKCGCDRGDCGTCTVVLDQKTVRSCLVLAVEVEGHEVTTLEGVMKEGLTPLQQKFIDKNSFQCGFCAPGMVMAATELVNAGGKPTEGDIREALAGNLCRCTGYTPIIDAIIDHVK